MGSIASLLVGLEPAVMDIDGRLLEGRDDEARGKFSLGPRFDGQAELTVSSCKMVAECV